MTLQDFIPLVDFYKIYRGHLKKSKYKLLLCLIARKADAPLLSLHDVTGENILFMFAGDTLEENREGPILTYWDLDFKSAYFGHWRD